MRFFTILLVLTSLSIQTRSASNELPTLGDATSGLISLQQEYRLGRAWLQNLRQQAAVISDPVLTEYTENLIYRLASNSEVKDLRLEIILLDNPQLNAFAVPGGIIGINAGLFLYAQNESQFAAVMAHELAHLSQRHFARQVEESRKQAPIAMATLLGSIMLLATNNTEAGFAGLMTSQAAATQWALSYSRDWEREADRLGMHTLVNSGFDPEGMPSMFEQMYNAHKYSERPPEFLLTHPVTESRIADAAARVDNLKKVKETSDLDYQLVRTALLRQYKSASHNLNFFQQAVTKAKSKDDKLIALYGLAQTHLDREEHQEALAATQQLIKEDKSRIGFITLHAKALYSSGNKKAALNLLEQNLNLTPDNHPLTMAYADLLMKEQNFQKARNQLQRHVLLRSTDPAIWQKLGEAEGKLGNEVGQHRARAEFFFLTGYKQKALKQLEIALEQSEENYLVAARIQQRAREISASDKNLDF